ncbi:MAG: crossover junction endodeoxyribonuclease RuvC [Actinobacteria bacterium]|jgi:crossover junction endodeoxyribonuclease RuvC|nr:crossover junction endodeoxyribonuclease RuvC [Actinomycetota bacterium]MCL6105531.1 crossover junction endodeoxyribonuclease RuvC [Actinomycetota bacterium]
MFVLGIDPGLSRCGYGCVDDGWVLADAGVISTHHRLELPKRLEYLFEELKRLMLRLQPQVVAVERVFFQVNARTAMPTAQAGGLALLAAQQAGCKVVQYTSNEVKMAVVGYGGATKAQVQNMVMMLLSLDEIPQPADVADALGLAICHLSSLPLQRALSKSTTPPSRTGLAEGSGSPG